MSEEVMEDLGEGAIHINRMMYKSNNFVSENNSGGTVVFNGGNSQLGGENRPRQGPDARRFLEDYYTLLDGNHNDLANLYHEDSVFSIGNETYLGSQNIVAKLTSIPFQPCRRSCTSFNCQPRGINGGLLVLVCGNLQIAGRDDALKFSEVFHLMPTLQGSYYVKNDILTVNDA